MGTSLDDCWGNALTLCLVLGYIMSPVGGKMLRHNPVIQIFLYLIVMCVGPCRSEILITKAACRLQIIKAVEEYEYIQEGDIMIGGVLTVSMFQPEDYFTGLTCISPSAQNYKYLVDFLYVVQHFNKKPDILPNKTLGYHISDSCGDLRKAVKSILLILSGTREPVPNYSCVGKRNIAGFIGDLTSETTIPIAQILSVFGYTQISYGATDPALSDRSTFPYFFRTTESDAGYYVLISKIAKYFQWNWVGIIRSNDERGERDHQLLKYYLSSENICIEFILKIADLYGNIFYREILRKASANVIIFCGAVNIHIILQFRYLYDMLSDKTFILTSNWLYYNHLIDFSHKIFHGSLLLMQNKENYPSNSPYAQFSKGFKPSRYPDDKLLEYIWLQNNFCLHKNQFIWPFYNCSEQESIAEIPMYNSGFHTYNMIYAADMFVKALHYMHHSPGLGTSGMSKKVYNYRYKVSFILLQVYTCAFMFIKIHRYLRQIQYLNNTNHVFSFNENGEFVTLYLIINLYPNLRQQSAWKICGTYFSLAPTHRKLNITPAEIQWKTKNNKVPRSQCSDSCPTGFRKTFKLKVQPCCYDCVLCSEGEISNRTDSENCIRCPYNEWPNEKRNQCIAKIEEFLSYTNNAIPVFFSVISALLLLKTVMILGVFIFYRDSPIVRANNRSLSFLLLVSIKLSFLSVFLFLGRPVDITCMLRIITFGITFSIAVSSLLAKTIMVCVAFKATKPGSSWRKWLGVKLSNSVVLFCSSIQIIICMTWLAISPPFQELDIHTSPGTIIIQCNEGSAIGFYSVIGYMGLLAAVSFVLAFLARSLPDSFNEAKYITFSMLLFCSVWITMIPAYLSTKGKNTVCVEIFAIITSSAGLLACIFLPKCYIILLRPERNRKEYLIGRSNN
uniref:G-protein coupled receptors family 3 profile domain-containing protein n=1 Tax=Xenopus tropicalis TaxID=8364 RepID=A0A1B8Y6A9_XENTR